MVCNEFGSFLWSVKRITMCSTSEGEELKPFCFVSVSVLDFKKKQKQKRNNGQSGWYDYVSVLFRFCFGSVSVVFQFCFCQVSVRFWFVYVDREFSVSFQFRFCFQNRNTLVIFNKIGQKLFCLSVNYVMITIFLGIFQNLVYLKDETLQCWLLQKKLRYAQSLLLLQVSSYDF